MSFCDVSYDADDEGELIFSSRMAHEGGRDTQCSSCEETIPGGEYFQLVVWEGGGCVVFKQCDFCADAFSEAEYARYMEKDILLEAMVSRIDDLSEAEVIQEHHDWFKKPEAFRKEFDRRFPAVFDALMARLTKDYAAKFVV